MQDTKYYIPTIEEFHVGFEFEYNDINCEGRSGFHSCIVEDIFTISFPNIKGYYGEDEYKQLFSKILWEINREHIRVRYLDREDIESLGFVEKEKNYFVKDNWAIFFKNDLTTIMVDDYRGVKMYEDAKCTRMVSHPHAQHLKIKNKSELKKLLTQLGIC